MGMFNDLFKRVWEAKAGRIYWYSNMWAIIGSRWDKKRLQNKNLTNYKHCNENGEWEKGGLTLVNRRCTPNCPAPPIDDVHISEKGKAWVPATECRKCPYHVPAARGQFNFPRCTFERATDAKGIAQATLNAFSGICNEVKDKIDEVMGVDPK